MRSPLILALIIVLLLGSSVAVGVSGASPAIPDGSVDLSAPDRPVLVYDVSLAADGSAAWNVSIFFPTDSEAGEDAFDAVVTEYQEDGGDAYLPIEPFEVTAADAEGALDRAMSIEGVDRSTHESEAVGVVSLTFTWAGFALLDDPYLEVGDVFSATQEPWLTSLQEDEYVLIHPPDGYQVESSGMQLANRTMWAAGPIDLSDAQLQGTFVQEGADTGGESGLSSTILGGIGLGTVLLIALLAGAYQRGLGPFRQQESMAGVEPVDPAVSEADEKQEPESDEPDLSLLSDEERVIRLIEANGGRMKQATIVEETDWSNAKVSQLLSTMADEGQIEKLRLGRENLISFPEEDSQ